MLSFINKLPAIIGDMTASVGVYFDCPVADETRASLLFFEPG